MLCSLIVELLELHCLYFVTRRFVFVNWQISFFDSLLLSKLQQDYRT